jgi:hypothetical protein
MSTRVVSLSDITNLEALLQNGGPCVLMSQGCPLQARALPLDLGAVPRPGLSPWLRVAGADASAAVLMAEHGADGLHRVLVQTLGRIEKAFSPTDVPRLVEIAVQQLQCDQRESRQLDRTAMVIIASAIALDYASSAEASIAIARQVWPGIRPLPNVPPPATPTPPPALLLPYPLLSPPPPSPARPPAPDHQAHEQLLPQPQQVQETAEVRRERRSRSWSGSSTSEEDNEEVGGASSEAGEDDAVIAKGESSSESRALRLWKRSATKHCREVAMELIGSWQFGDPVENAWLPRLPWPVVMLIARLSVAVPRPE